MSDPAMIHLWRAIEDGEFASVQALAPPGFDFRAALHPTCQCTPLQMAIDRMVSVENDDEEKKTFEMIEWLLNRGADPLACAPDSCCHEIIVSCANKDNSQISVDCSEHSAISLIIDLKLAMKEKMQEKNDHEDDADWDFDWGSDLVALTRLSDLLCAKVCTCCAFARCAPSALS